MTDNNNMGNISNKRFNNIKHKTELIDSNINKLNTCMTNRIRCNSITGHIRYRTITTKTINNKGISIKTNNIETNNKKGYLIEDIKK